MSAATWNVLFLCTGNSCRSILAECILNRLGGGRFRGFSAGSRPTGAVHPRALALLERRGHPTGDLRSKGWGEFAAEGAPVMGAVITVCDNAAGEVCPVWPGRPANAHWGFPDPAAFHGGEAETEAFFTEVYRRIEDRVSRFVNLSPEAPDRAGLQRRLEELGTYAAEKDR
jgi:protein-tyrosine-phosphatase